MFSQLLKLIRVLSSEASPLQISTGLALSMIMGLTPLFNLHNLLVIFFLLIFRVNIAAFLLGWAFFSGLAYLMDPLFHDLGKSILTYEALNPVWTEMYNSNLWRLSQFNNTIVMGSLVTSLIAFIPLIIIANLMVKNYRVHVLTYAQQSRIFMLLKSSKLITRLISMAE